MHSRLHRVAGCPLCSAISPLPSEATSRPTIGSLVLWQLQSDLGKRRFKSTREMGRRIRSHNCLPGTLRSRFLYIELIHTFILKYTSSCTDCGHLIQELWITSLHTQRTIRSPMSLEQISSEFWAQVVYTVSNSISFKLIDFVQGVLATEGQSCVTLMRQCYRSWATA